MRRLPEDTQEVLRVASAGGTATAHPLLAAVSGLDDAALTRALRPAVLANVLRALGDGYSFRHELIREAVHDDLLPGEHGRLHSRFAEAIDADPALVPPGRAAVEMAHHWHSAHDSPRALIAAWQAAAQAGRSVAAAERLSLLARVLGLWDQVPDAATRIGADHVRVLEEATCAASDTGELERGIALATSALKELDPAAEPVRVARLLEDRSTFRSRLGRADYTQDLYDALSYVPDDVAPVHRISILLFLARCAPAVTDERAYADEALALARRIGDEVCEANALLTLAMFHADPGQQAGPDSDSIALIDQARAVGERSGAASVLLKAAINASHVLEGAGEHERAAEAARTGIASADAERLSRTSGSLLAINQAEPLFALGRWDEANQLIAGALDLYHGAGPLHRALLQVVTGNIACARGDLTAGRLAASTARDIMRSARYEDQHQLPLARLEITLALAADGPAAALAATGQAIDRFDLAASSPRYTWLVMMAGAGAVLAAARQVAVSHDDELGEQAAATAARLRTVAEKLAWFGPVQQAQQLTFAAADAHAARLLETGDGSGAGDDSGAGGGSGAGGAAVAVALRSGWDEAAAAWEAVSEPYPLAQALLQAAEAALAGGDRDSAAARLTRATALATALGTQPLGQEIAILARRAGIRLTRPDDGEPGPDGAGRGATAAGISGLGLTGRELEVLRLVAAGRSNREIAAELFISPKTASVHVSNILGKLGAASRGEAAATAHALRLFDPASTG